MFGNQNCVGPGKVSTEIRAENKLARCFVASLANDLRALSEILSLTGALLRGRNLMVEVIYSGDTRGRGSERQVLYSELTKCFYIPHLPVRG